MAKIYISAIQRYLGLAKFLSSENFHVHGISTYYTNLEEVFDSLWVIAVALSADSLHLLHLTSLTGSLRKNNSINYMYMTCINLVRVITKWLHVYILSLTKLMHVRTNSQAR